MRVLKSANKKLIWLLKSLPHLLATRNRKRLASARSACNTIEIIERLGINPHTLFDVGAHESEWAWWLHRKYHKMEIMSFDPVYSHKILGTWIGFALSDFEGKGRVTGDGVTANVAVDKHGPISIKRFEQCRVISRVPPESILKVDAEDSTVAVLRGFGDKLKEFRLLHVEETNDGISPQVIGELAHRAGFTHRKVVFSVYNGGHEEFLDAVYWKE